MSEFNFEQIDKIIEEYYFIDDKIYKLRSYKGELDKILNNIKNMSINCCPVRKDIFSPIIYEKCILTSNYKFYFDKITEYRNKFCEIVKIIPDKISILNDEKIKLIELINEAILYLESDQCVIYDKMISLYK
jgi:hypothetical protein